jgi:hypothetical protein
MANQACIFDQQGNILWQGDVQTSLAGLNGGETFWFGTPEDRTWTKIVSISYGLRTDSGDLLLEIVVDAAAKQPTKARKLKVLDHGEKLIRGEQGGAASVEGRGITVTVGKLGDGRVERMTVQCDTQNGPPLVKTETDFKTGSSLQAGDSWRVVTATLVHAYWHTKDTRVRITEHINESQ